MENKPSVSLHPYFKIHPGKLPDARALLDIFVTKTTTEADCLYYEFTQADDIVFCREAYKNAAAVLQHLENVGPELGEMLKLSDMLRLEIHGPGSELDLLRQPLAELPVQWFVYQCGVSHDA